MNSRFKSPALTFVCALSAFSACGTDGELRLGNLPSVASDSDADADGLGGEPLSSGGGPSTGGASSFGGQVGQGGALPLPPCEPGAVLPQPSHRYDFSGTGSQVVDLRGGPAGEIVGNAELTGSGVVVLDGDDYVNLPNGLLGGGPERTIMIWATAQAGPAYWRVFDFGMSSAGEDFDRTEASVGTYYIALTTETGFDPNGLALLMGFGGPSSEFRALTSVDVQGKLLTAAVVLSESAGTAELYFDGQVIGEAPLPGDLSEIDDQNNWLGRSQYAADPLFDATYDEVRIYDQALSACQVSALTALGPDDPG